MKFPVVIHKDRDSDYGVSVPDLPGCVSAGATVDDALEMVREAIELHLEGLIEEGEVIPMPGSIEKHQANRHYSGGIWAVVEIDTSNLRLKSVRINITMPERVLSVVDAWADKNDETRSGLLARAAMEFIRSAPQRDKAKPAAQAAKPAKPRKPPAARNRP